MRALVLATHAPPTVAVTLVATLLAVSAGVTPGRVVLLCAAVLAGQASIGWSNDWLDADRDRAVGRTDKPVVQGGVRPELLRSAAISAAAVAVVLSLLLGLVPGLLLLTLVGSGWAYNAGLKRTWLSWLGYVVGFGALPAGVVAAATGTPLAPWWLVFAGAALGGAAHLANVAPDLEDDLATGVRGLPHRLGARLSALLGALLLGERVARPGARTGRSSDGGRLGGPRARRPGGGRGGPGRGTPVPEGRVPRRPAADRARCRAAADRRGHGRLTAAPPTGRS